MASDKIAFVIGSILAGLFYYLVYAPLQVRIKNNKLKQEEEERLRVEKYEAEWNRWQQLKARHEDSKLARKQHRRMGLKARDHYWMHYKGESQSIDHSSVNPNHGLKLFNKYHGLNARWHFEGQRERAAQGIPSHEINRSRLMFNESYAKVDNRFKFMKMTKTPVLNTHRGDFQTRKRTRSAGRPMEYDDFVKWRKGIPDPDTGYIGCDVGVPFPTLRARHWNRALDVKERRRARLQEINYPRDGKFRSRPYSFRRQGEKLRGTEDRLHLGRLTRESDIAAYGFTAPLEAQFKLAPSPMPGNKWINLVSKDRL